MRFLLIILMALSLHQQGQTQTLPPMEDLLHTIYDEAGVKAYILLAPLPGSSAVQHSNIAHSFEGQTLHYDLGDCAFELTFLSEDELSLRSIYPDRAHETAIPYTLSHLENGEALVLFTNEYGQEISCYHDLASQSVTMLVQTDHWASIFVGSFWMAAVTIR